MTIRKKLTKSVLIIFCFFLTIYFNACHCGGACEYITDIRTKIFAIVPSKNKIDIISTSTNNVLGSIKTDEKPSNVAVSPDGKMILATNSGSGTVSVFLKKNNDEYQKLNSVGSGNRPSSIIFNPRFSEAYVAYEGDSRILVLDTRSVTSAPKVNGVVSLQGSSPQKMVISPDGTRLFVTDSKNDKLLILTKIGTKLITKSGEISFIDNSLSETSNNSIFEGIIMTKQEKIYISDYIKDRIIIVDGKKTTAKIESINLREGIGFNLTYGSSIGPKNMAIYTTLAGREKIYVAGYNASIVSSIDVKTSKVVNIPLSGNIDSKGNKGKDSYNPIGVAVANFNGKDFIYVSNSAGLSLSLIDPETDKLERNTSTSNSIGEQDPYGEILSIPSYY